jgi:hypothetical protein
MTLRASLIHLFKHLSQRMHYQIISSLIKDLRHLEIQLTLNSSVLKLINKHQDIIKIPVRYNLFPLTVDQYQY